MNYTGKSAKEREHVYTGEYRKADKKKLQETWVKLRPESIDIDGTYAAYLGQAQKLLDDEFARLELPLRRFPVRQIFVLSHEVFDRLFPSGAWPLVACYSFTEDFIAVNRECSSDSLRGPLHPIVHELTHALARTVMIRNVKEGVLYYRSGHAACNTVVGGDHVLGNALNEAITEKITRELLGISSAVLQEMHGINQQEWTVYNYYIDTLNNAINAIARETETEFAMVWKRFKRAHFSGCQKHLLDLDRLLGQNSRKILELAGARRADRGRAAEASLLGMISRYFREEDPVVRESLGVEILTMNTNI